MKIQFINKQMMGVAVLVFASLMSSCSDFLSEKAFTSYEEEDFYSSPDRLSMATLGLYGVLSQKGSYGTNLLITEAGTDMDQCNSTAVSTSINDPQQVACYNVMIENTVVEGVWQLLYDGVNRANLILANADRVPIRSENDRKRVAKYVAETKVLRGYLYLDLVRRWGDVPFRTTPASLSENLFVTRTPRAQIYDAIIRDMEEAISDLPYFDEDATQQGRINKGVAMGLLARTCLFAGGYSLYMDGQLKRPDNYLDYYRKAEKVLRELIESKHHKLASSYETIFKNICGNVLEPSESMFEIDMAYLYGASAHAGSIGTTATGVAITNHSSLYNCNPKVYTNYFMWLKYGAGDLRRDLSIANYTLNGTTFTKSEVAVKQSNKWSCAKWRRDWHASVPSNWALSDVNCVVMRYSEILLMQAEVLNELGNGAPPSPEAIGLVNMVRRRGYGLPIETASAIADVPADVCADNSAFFRFLTDEYAREFFGEVSGRRFHLIRWNLLKEKIQETAAKFADPANVNYHSLKNYLPGQCFVSGKSELWPIPYREMVEHKGSLGENNPGY